MPRDPIAVAGSGTWGVTLAQLATFNQARVRMWTGDAPLRGRVPGRTLSSAMDAHWGPGRVEPCDDLETVVRGAGTILVVIPTRLFRTVARRLGDFVEGDQAVVSCAKGLEDPHGTRMSEIVAQESCARLIGALGGPADHLDLRRGGVGAAVIGSRFSAVIRRVQQGLESERLRVFGDHDLLGVELGGALAKVLGLMNGIVEGLELGASVKAVVADRGLAEISRIGEACGARRDTFSGLACLGDIVAVAASGQGRDHDLGRRLGTGTPVARALEVVQAAESVATVRMVLKLADRHHIRDIPLFRATASILFDGTSPRAIVSDLMTRPATEGTRTTSRPPRDR